MTIPAELLESRGELTEALNRVRRDVVTPSALKQPYITLVELEGMCDNKELVDMLEETVTYCVQYILSVTKFMQVVAVTDDFKSEVFQQADNARKRKHDATFDQINMFARMLKLSGKDSTWVGKLAGNRFAYGKFALLLGFEKLEQGREE